MGAIKNARYLFYSLQYGFFISDVNMILKNILIEIRNDQNNPIFMSIIFQLCVRFQYIVHMK